MLIKKFWKLYPISKNRISVSIKRVKLTTKKRIELRKFGKEYFDGGRTYGCGGYYYKPIFFKKIVKAMIKYYKLNNNSKILDVGCAKGFMMYEFKRALPKSKVYGIDVSRYCKKNAVNKNIKKNIKIASCDDIPFPDNYFDFVISISTIHNLGLSGVKKSLKEINRVGNGKSFIKVNGYKDSKEKKLLNEWNVVAKTILSESSWKKIFKDTDYKGDYDWFKI
tara:strand:- start:6343 stop:7008 length:666 start_codon:yes stop_codon:yes gene_type:complete